MRRRLLVVLAAVAACLGTALVAVPSAQAVTPPPADQDWAPCTGPSDDYCVESATANGVDTFPGVDTTDGTVTREYPWVKFATPHVVDYGVWKDVSGDGGTLDNVVSPGVTYRLVVRTGSFYPREMTGIVSNADYAISKSVTGGWRFTLQFQPTAVHHSDPGTCSVDGGCVSDTTKATFDVSGFASGGIEDHVGSGLSASEIAQRTGMFQVTNAQDEYLFYNIDLGVLEVRLANPHLTSAPTDTPVTDGVYEAFIPNAFLTGTIGVPDPSVLPGFTVTKTIGTTTTAASASMTHVSGGIRIQIAGISFSRPIYRLKPRPTPPGRPRSVRATKPSTHKARVSFAKPLLNGGRRIDWYQARCHRLGGTWHYARRSASPIYVGSLPKGRVWCQVRAHNAKGYGKWSALDRT